MHCDDMLWQLTYYHDQNFMISNMLYDTGLTCYNVRIPPRPPHLILAPNANTDSPPRKRVQVCTAVGDRSSNGSAAAAAPAASAAARQ